MTFKKSWVIGLLVATTLAGCWGNREVLQQSGAKPGWVDSSKESMTETRDGTKFVLYRTTIPKARDLALAKREARFELVKAIANEVSADVRAVFGSEKDGSSNQIDQSSDMGGAIRDAVVAVSSVRLANLKIEEVYWERRLYNLENGPREGYELHVLGSVPEKDLNQLKIEAIEAGQKAARKERDKKAEQRLDEMLRQVETP